MGSWGWGQGALVGGIGKAPRGRFLFLLCSPGLLSGALLRPPGTWLRPPRPSVDPCRPRPGLGSPRLLAFRKRLGCPAWGKRDPGAIGWGSGGEALVKFSEPRAGIGVRLRGSGGESAWAGRYSLSDSGQPRGETPSKSVSLEAVLGEGDVATSLPSLALAGVEGERSLWGSLHTPWWRCCSWWRWMVRVYIPPLPFVCRDILLAMLIWTKFSPHATLTPDK